MDAIGKINTNSKNDSISNNILIIIKSIAIIEIFSRMKYNPLSVIHYSILAFLLTCFVVLFIYYKNKIKQRQLLYLYLFIVIIICIRGIYDSSNYWDLKGAIINKFLFLLTPLMILFGNRIIEMINFYRFLIKYYIPLCLILTQSVFYPALGLPLSFLILSLPIIKQRLPQLLIVTFLLLSIHGNLTARGWIIRITFIIMAIILYKIRINKNIKSNIIKTGYIILIVTPLSFLTLGYTGTYNIFAFEKNTGNKVNLGDEFISADTRSGLYSRVQETLERKNMVLWGLGASSSYWDNFYKNVKQLKGRGREATESGILNMYLYSGLIGAIIYSLIFWTSSYQAIFRSNSLIAKILGIFILFRWVVSFIDEPEAWILNNITIFWSIGLCYSEKFRQMIDSEIIYIINGNK